jgi:hypothetical protein
MLLQQYPRREPRRRPRPTMLLRRLWRTPIRSRAPRVSGSPNHMRRFSR